MIFKIKTNSTHPFDAFLRGVRLYQRTFFLAWGGASKIGGNPNLRLFISLILFTHIKWNFTFWQKISTFYLKRVCKVFFFFVFLALKCHLGKMFFLSLWILISLIYSYFFHNFYLTQRCSGKGRLPQSFLSHLFYDQ